MFTDDLSEDWESTENQDIFIKKYFGKEKVLSREAQHVSKQANDSKNVDAKKTPKKIHVGQGIKNGPDSFNTDHITNECALDYRAESSKKRKKRKKSSDNSSIDHGTKIGANGMEFKETDKKDSFDSNLKSKKRRRKSKNKNGCVSNGDASVQMRNTEKELPAETENTVDKLSPHSSVKKSNLFQDKIHQKLQAAKFRYLNEMLYTNSGKDALSYFQENTDEFEDYHVGYQSQVSKWPINPVEVIIEEIRHMNKQAVIADLGCGEAKIAEVFPKRTVHSFDLIALKDCVTACDMANVPLPSSSVDVAVFCLSLMGTNWKDFVKEGHRLLKLDGMLKIAEIESRIEDLDCFIKNIQNYGFSLINKDLSHKMFVFLNFKKVNRSKKSSKVPSITLKPCLYKKR